MIAAASPLPLASYLPAILLDLDQEGIARLPHVPGLPWSVGARWVQRRMIGESWRPLVFSEPSALSPVYWPDILELARRGWVAIPSGHLPPDFAPLARQAGVGLLLPDPTEATADVAALLRQDRHYAVETDPSLRDLRRSLLAHCRG
ncbi:MAG TPA: hypothetical protein PKY30_27260, partial [Myxococcota bacterium]|nr:hypothetical protein [Myxococcota bacterium]